MLLPALVLIFGVFEFGRMLMAWNMLNNAAREGCRYALVNNTSATIETDVQTQVVNRMAGQDTQAFSAFTVTVGGSHAGTAVASTNAGVNSLVAGDLITVTVSGNYKFMNIIPFINFGSMTLTSSPTMVCEGVN